MGKPDKTTDLTTLSHKVVSSTPRHKRDLLCSIQLQYEYDHDGPVCTCITWVSAFIRLFISYSNSGEHFPKFLCLQEGTTSNITKNGYTRLATASDKVYQLLVHGRWLSPGTPVSSTTKTGHHAWYSWNIAQSGVKHQISSNQAKYYVDIYCRNV